MKIIGKGKDSFIIEASENEVANLIGYYSKYKDGFKVFVGDDIQIDEMYKQLYELEQKQPELEKIVNTLRGLADLLEPVCPVIEKVVKEATKRTTKEE